MIEYNINKNSDIDLTDDELNQYDEPSIRLYNTANKKSHKKSKYRTNHNRCYEQQ